MPRIAVSVTKRKHGALIRNLRAVKAKRSPKTPMQPTAGAFVHTVRGPAADGQALAGQGVTVFEGELLDLDRRWH